MGKSLPNKNDNIPCHPLTNGGNGSNETRKSSYVSRYRFLLFILQNPRICIARPGDLDGRPNSEFRDGRVKVKDADDDFDCQPNNRCVRRYFANKSYYRNSITIKFSTHRSLNWRGTSERKYKGTNSPNRLLLLLLLLLHPAEEAVRG